MFYALLTSESIIYSFLKPDLLPITHLKSNSDIKTIDMNALKGFTEKITAQTGCLGSHFFSDNNDSRVSLRAL